MSNAPDIVRLIKKIAEEGGDSKKPMAVQTGTVISVSPLKIKADNNMEHDYSLGDLILTHLVRDYEVDITVNHSTDSIYQDWDTTHSHPGAGANTIPIDHEHEYTGRKKIIMHLGLKVGEKVLLIQEQGGQRWIVVDRIEDPLVTGEWYNAACER